MIEQKHTNRLSKALPIREQRWLEEDEPTVSVCCITYNHEDYIVDCIEGFLNQETNFQVEILIHDDASEDKTQSILNRYLKKYPHIIRLVLQSENQYKKGVGFDFIFGFNQAKGKYIALCEGDDYWIDSEKLLKQVNWMEQDPEAILCFGPVCPIDECGHLLESFPTANQRDLSETDLKKGKPVNTCTALFRNVVGEVHQELNMARIADITIWARLGHHGGYAKYLPGIEPTIYRVHGGGIFSMADSDKRSEMVLVSSVALFLFFNKVNDRDMVEYYAKRIAKNMLENLETRTLLSMLVRIIKNIIRPSNRQI